MRYLATLLINLFSQLLQPNLLRENRFGCSLPYMLIPTILLAGTVFLMLTQEIKNYFSE